MATRKELTSYFPHDSNARNSDKLIRLRMRHKAAGYGVYFMILERLREEPEYTSVKDYNMIAFDLREDASLIKSVVEDFGLFVFTDDGKYFYSESFKQRMEIKDEQSRKKAEAGKKGLEKRWGNSKNIANATGNDSNKRKEKESKEKESKEKYPPPLSPAGGNGGCGNNLFSKDSNTDGIERNFEGLTNRLNRLFIPPDEFNIICQLSNNGEIGHPIWTIIQAAERGGARLHSPGKYIISELKKAIKK
ncbi:Lin1244/Lin1753 domain-containing protein [Parabacteroides johnsonii]|uniref:Lin1244/Lin1753 domain-containing protein n=1 Tax=Parabacteroides johnsonii TaxID=387661 RepID=UPI0011DD2B55|nr:Lin1244/Lin1753 domain-containing protein [Parabacteroides johnsonii]